MTSETKYINKNLRWTSRRQDQSEKIAQLAGLNVEDFSAMVDFCFGFTIANFQPPPLVDATEITVNVGSIVTGRSGQTNDTRKTVKFHGEKIGSYTSYGYDRIGSITDTRGTTQTLYRTSDNRLIVHIDDWSKYQGEPDTETLVEITREDLLPGGRFEDLGQESKLSRPMTLDEALEALDPGY